MEKLDITLTNELLNQVMMSLTDDEIENMVKYEAVCNGHPSNCFGGPKPLRMIAYDDMVINGMA